jgi:hypothetical protein
VVTREQVELGWWPASRISELQSFLDAEWKRGHVLAVDEELLRWQHPRNDEELAVVGATHEDRLVGILGVVPVAFCVRGSRVAGAWLTTWVAAADWRRRQLGLRLLDFVLHEHDFVGTVGGNETTTHILAALSFHIRPSVPRWVLALTPESLARLVGVDARSIPFSRASGAFLDPVVEEWSPALAECWDETWNERLAGSVVGTCRDAAYIERRYAEHPRFDYTIRLATGSDSRARALLVHRLEAVRGADATVIRVVEALGDESALHVLAQRLAEDGRASGVAFADFYCTTGRWVPSLARAGFVPEESLPLAFPSRLQPLEAGSRPLAAAFRLAGGAGELGEDLYCTRSDADQDRPS